MIRALRSTGFPARLFVLAREAFEASVAIHYDAPWKQSPPARCVPGVPVS